LLFDALYKSAPNDPAVFLTEAGLLANDRQWTELRDKVTSRFKTEPNDVATFTHVANQLAAINDPQSQKLAEDILRMVLENNTQATEAMSSLAMILQVSGRTEESAALYRRILKLEPDNVIAANNLAWILCEEQGKYQEALELIRPALRKAPDYVDLIDTCGMIYYRLGEYNKAAQNFSRCTELYSRRSPSLTSSYFHFAKALIALGQENRAKDNLQATLDLNTKIGGLSPGDLAEAKRMLGELSQGR